MGLLEGTLGLDKTTTTTQLNSETIAKEEELQRQQETQEQVTKETGITSTLDEQTQQLVKDLISQLSSGVLDAEATGLAELSTAIIERSKTAQEDVSSQIGAITEDARLRGEQELEALQTQLAQQAGGSLANTLVTSATGVARSNLEASIARTRGELNLQARQVVSDELSAALTGVSQAKAATDPVENITNLLNILKGATVEQKQTGQVVSTAESELSRLLDSISTTESLQTSQTKKMSASLGFGASN